MNPLTEAGYLVVVAAADVNPSTAKMLLLAEEDAARVAMKAVAITLAEEEDSSSGENL